MNGFLLFVKGEKEEFNLPCLYNYGPISNPSVTSGKRPWEHVTQGPAAGALKNPAGLESPLGRKPDSSLRARGPHGQAAALKG